MVPISTLMCSQDSKTKLIFTRECIKNSKSSLREKDSQEQALKSLKFTTNLQQTQVREKRIAILIRRPLEGEVHLGKERTKIIIMLLEINTEDIKVLILK
jgi:hypothetical protein